MMMTGRRGRRELGRSIDDDGEEEEEMIGKSLAPIEGWKGVEEQEQQDEDEGE